MGSLGPKQIKRDPMPSNQRVCCHGPIGRYTWRVVLGLCFLSALLIAFRYWSIHDAQGSLLYYDILCYDADLKRIVSERETSVVNRHDERASRFRATRVDSIDLADPLQ